MLTTGEKGEHATVADFAFPPPRGHQNSDFLKFTVYAYSFVGVNKVVYFFVVFRSTSRHQ